MPEQFSPEDQAALYVMGEGSPQERLEFEAQMESSPELREWVRECEAGAVALAMAAPQKQLPQQIWLGIQEKVDQQIRRQKILTVWFAAWRNGWAVAAALAVAWLIHSLWMIQQKPEKTFVAESSQPGEFLPTDPSGKAISPGPPVPPRTEAIARLLQAKTRETTSLNGQVADLKNQIAQLSQSVTQQQALLSESNRIKFFHMTSESHAGGETAIPQQLSPNLQRLVFLAMARELGWISANPDPGSETNGASRFAGSNNGFNVDFVDFRSNTNGTKVVVPSPMADPPKIQSQVVDSTEQAEPIPSPADSIPVFAPGGDKLFIPVDSTIASAGSTIDIYSNSQLVGTAVMGANPTIAIIPFSTRTANVWTVSVTTGSTTTHFTGSAVTTP